MNPYFKFYIKKAAVGFVSCSTIGATCGSAAGVAGLSQMCSGVMDTPTCNYLVSSAKYGAASSGAGVGAVIGGLLGVTVYPVYKGLVAWYYQPAQLRSGIHINPESELVEVKQSPNSP